MATSGGNSIGVYGSSSVASGTNYGLFATATGGTTNYAGWFDAGNVIVNDRNARYWNKHYGKL